MDTRKLKVKSLTRYEASIYFAHPDPERPNDHGQQVTELTGSEDAAELVRRWNNFPALVEALEECLQPIGRETLADLRDEDCGLSPATYNKVCALLATLKA
jgi:hypothetical protein